MILVYIIESVHNNSEDDIQEEEGANDDQEYAEADSHPGLGGVSHVVHNSGPTFKSDHLEDGDNTGD